MPASRRTGRIAQVRRWTPETRISPRRRWRRRPSRTPGPSLQQSVDQARAASETLKQQVGELKRKIDEGERTATTLVARKNAASAQRKVAEALAGAGSANNAFAGARKF